MDLWSLRALGRLRAVRWAVKGLFHLRFRHGRVYRIASGPLRGWLWYHHREHPFWMPLGQYERETAEWLKATLRPGAVFFDVGAHAGYMTLLGSLRVGSAGRVIAFEPVPLNQQVIRKQIEANGLDNVEVEPVAVSECDGTATCNVTANIANAHLGMVEMSHASGVTRHVIEVRTIRLDTYVERAVILPDVIKIDVEGAELQVLEGARGVLSRVHPAVLVSTHSGKLLRGSREVLESLGYEVRALGGFEHELVARVAG